MCAWVKFSLYELNRKQFLMMTEKDASEANVRFLTLLPEK